MGMEIRSDLAGFRAATQSMAARSERIARASLSQTEIPLSSDDRTDSGPDLVDDIVGMTTDRLAGAYDVKAQKVKDSMMGTLLDLVR